MNKFLFVKISTKEERMFNYQCEICKRISQYSIEMRQRPPCISQCGPMVLLNVVIKQRK